MNRYWNKLKDGDLHEFSFLAVDVVAHSQLIKEYSRLDVNNTFNVFASGVISKIRNRNGHLLSWAGDGGLFAFYGNEKEKSAVLGGIDILKWLPTFNRYESSISDVIDVRMGVNSGNALYNSDPGLWHVEEINLLYKCLKEFTKLNTLYISESVIKELSTNLKKDFSNTAVNICGLNFYQSKEPVSARLEESWRLKLKIKRELEMPKPISTKEQYVDEVCQLLQESQEVQIICMNQIVPYIFYTDNEDLFLKLRETEQKLRHTMMGVSDEVRRYFKCFWKAYRDKKRFEYIMSQKSIDYFIEVIKKTLSSKEALELVNRWNKYLNLYNIEIKVVMEDQPYCMFISDKKALFATIFPRTSGIVHQGPKIIAPYRQLFDLPYSQGQPLQALLDQIRETIMNVYREVVNSRVAQIFISHSTKPDDRVFLSLLCDELEKHEIGYYVAEENPVFGYSLWSKIEKVIQECQRVIAILTKEGISSAYVNQEIAFAKARGKEIIPIVEEGIQLHGFPVGWEYISYNRSKPLEAVRAVIKYLTKAEKEKSWVIPKIDPSHNYQYHIYKSYEKLTKEDNLYAAISSWPILDEDKKCILIKMEPKESIFLGPVEKGKTLLGVLWRVLINSERIRHGRDPFIIEHRTSGSRGKFIVSGNDVFISPEEVSPERPTKDFVFFENNPIQAEHHRAIFQDLRESGRTPLEERLLELISSEVSTEKNIKELVKDLSGVEEIEEPKLNDWVIGLWECLVSTIKKSKNELEIWGDYSDSECKVIKLSPPTPFEKVNKKAVEKPALRICLTAECNLRCKYCPQSNENFADCRGNINFKLLRNICQIAHSIGIRKLVFTGGEPLLLKDKLFNLFQELSAINHDMFYVISTNGLLLNDEVINSILKLKLPHIRLKVSLDTLQEDIFYQLTGRKGLKLVLHGIDRARKAGLKVGVNMVITKENVQKTFDIANYCLERGIYLKILDMNWYEDMPPRYWDNQYIDPRSIIPILKKDFGIFKVVNALGGYGIPMLQTDTKHNDSFIRIKSSYLGTTYAKTCLQCEYFLSSRCQEGIYQLCLTVDGRLKVCRHRPEYSINIFKLCDDFNMVSSSFENFLERFFSKPIYVRSFGLTNKHS
jgi:molybdenum cofactor biosynthesis enzyme MoaA